MIVSDLAVIVRFDSKIRYTIIRQLLLLI